MPYGELTLPPVYTGRTSRGRYAKGNVPYNKGKTWAEYMPKRAQKRAMKGWKNLAKYRPKHLAETAGRSRRQVIAIDDDGRWTCFSYIGAAAQWIGGNRNNVGRCCRDNQSRRVIRGGKTNTDHRYMGIRFYFEDDDAWHAKIK